MARLDDFLGLTRSAARKQWQGILARRVKPRQEPFVPVETLLAVALFYLLKPNRYGGGNIHTAPRPVHQLAVACKRTPGSFTNKMLNLDGSRAHGQAIEPRLFMLLHGDPGRLSELYRIILLAAREVGLDEEAVPDFLSLLDSSIDLFPLRPLDALVALDDTEASEKVAKAYELPFVEAERVVRARHSLNEHRYAQTVLDAWSRSCAFCGLTPRNVPATAFLSVARLKPPPHAVAAELKNTANGLATCSSHGLAFQQGWLGVGLDRAVVVSPALARDVSVDPGMARSFGPGALLRRLDERPRLDASCVEWHMTNRYRGG